MHMDILKRIKAGKFIYILVLPESLSNKQFHNIFTSPSFYLYVFLIVINYRVYRNNYIGNYIDINLFIVRLIILYGS